MVCDDERELVSEIVEDGESERDELTESDAVCESVRETDDDCEDDAE